MNGAHRPLVVTGQTDLLDDLLGAAAAVGVAVDVAVDLSACRPQWTSAPLVLVGDDIAPIDRRYDVLEFRVTPVDRSFGIANLHSRITIQRNPQTAPALAG